MLPENNKTTARADSECVHTTAFLLEQSKDFGSQLLPGAAAVLGEPAVAAPRGVLTGLPGQQKVPRGVPRNCPEPLRRIIQDLSPHYLADGGAATVAAFAREQIQAHSLHDNFYAVDLGRLLRLYEAFTAAMPRVRPFYAVKCNPDPALLRTLAALGAGFDCASAREMAAVLALGVPPERIVFAHPCKRPDDLAFAVTAGITRMTFDCEDELQKIAEAVPHAALLLRIKADDSASVVTFSHKYGACPEREAPALLAVAARLSLAVVGVSFHVGSGCQEPGAYRSAIAAARRVFDAAHAAGHRPTLLDIGGGFAGRFDESGSVVPLRGMAAAVNAALAAHFPTGAAAGPHGAVDVIAEPGRYFAEAVATLFTLVHTVKAKGGGGSAAPPASRVYYISDGVYGSFNAVVYDHAVLRGRVLRSPRLPPPSAAATATRVPSTVFGPTCDGVDVIFKDVPMPLLRRGDWFQFPDFGAYTIAGACPFNGLPVDAPRVFYTWSAVPCGHVEGNTVALSRRGAATRAAAADAPPEDEGVPEELLEFVGDLHDLDSIC